MTREERNTKLKNLITCLKCEESGKECDANCHVQYEAGNMGEIIENLEAISKALEQEPCECAISRQEVLDIVDSYSESQSNVEDVTQDIISDIVVLPSVNPQPKTGHWILDECKKHGYCSECGFGSVDLVGGESWNFCSNCGAKMVDLRKSEDAGCR